MYFVSIYRSTLLIGRFVFELFSDIRALFKAHGTQKISIFLLCCYARESKRDFSKRRDIE